MMSSPGMIWEQSNLLGQVRNEIETEGGLENS